MCILYSFAERLKIGFCAKCSWLLSTGVPLTLWRPLERNNLSIISGFRCDSRQPLCFHVDGEVTMYNGLFRATKMMWNTVPNKMHGSPQLCCSITMSSITYRIVNSPMLVFCATMSQCVVWGACCMRWMLCIAFGGPKSLIRAFVRALVTVACAWQAQATRSPLWSTTSMLFCVSFHQVSIFKKLAQGQTHPQAVAVPPQKRTSYPILMLQLILMLETRVFLACQTAMSASVFREIGLSAAIRFRGICRIPCHRFRWSDEGGWLS